MNVCKSQQGPGVEQLLGALQGFAGTHGVKDGQTADSWGIRDSVGTYWDPHLRIWVQTVQGRAVLEKNGTKLIALGSATHNTGRQM